MQDVSVQYNRGQSREFSELTLEIKSDNIYTEKGRHKLIKEER